MSALLGLLLLLNLGAGAALGPDESEGRSLLLEFETPASLDGLPLRVAYAPPTGPVYSVVVTARAGNHVYDLRHLPGWVQVRDPRQVRVHGAWLAGSRAVRLKRPTLRDELDVLLATQRLSPILVNDLSRRSLGGRSLEEVLVGVWVVCATVLFLLSRKLGRSVLQAVAIVLVLTELVSLVDHVSLVRSHEGRLLKMPVWGDILEFASESEARIAGSSWTSVGIDGVTRSMIHYRLAESRYVPPGATTPPDYVLRDRPGAGELVLALPGIAYLERAGR